MNKEETKNVEKHNEKNEEKKEIKNKKSEIHNKEEILKKQNEELEDRYKRLYAEFENYKKRTEKESLETYTRAKVDLVEKLLPVIDSFEKAEENMPKEHKEGMKLILRQVEEFLSSIGVEKIKAEGELFDPELHDAVKMTDTSGKPSNTVVTELRTGYMIGNNIIRHTMVEVQQ